MKHLKHNLYTDRFNNFTTMKISFEKKLWFEAKAKLQNLFHFLTESDFHYNPGEECKVPERIRKILGMSQREFYRLTGLYDREKELSQTHSSERSN
jgi:hypothetical protein